MTSPRGFFLLCLGTAGWLALFGPGSLAGSVEVANAVQAAREGVPEVSVARLRELLKNAPRDDDWRGIALQLVPALLDAREPAAALALLDDARLKTAPSTNLWRGQAFAQSQRWNEALSFSRRPLTTAPLPAKLKPSSARLRHCGLWDDRTKHYAVSCSARPRSGLENSRASPFGRSPARSTGLGRRAKITGRNKSKIGGRTEGAPLSARPGRLIAAPARTGCFHF